MTEARLSQGAEKYFSESNWNIRYASVKTRNQKTYIRHRPAVQFWELLGASQISSEYNLWDSVMRWVLNSSKLRPSWLQDLLFFLHLITRAIIVQTVSYGNDLIGFKSCSKGKCHRHLVLFPVFPVWKQITQIAKRKCHSCCHMESSMLQLKKNSKRKFQVS